MYLSKRDDQQFGGQPQQHIKLVCVGDGAVGKTCLLTQFAQNSYNEEYIPTIFDNSQTEIISLWDTSGQSDYSRIRPVSYQGANVFLVCFSIDSPQSLQNIKTEWAPELKHNANLDNVALVLVGTKEDLRSDNKIIEQLESEGQHIISQDEMKKAAKDIGADAFITCSAKTNENVQEVFQLAVKCVLEKKQKKQRKLCSFK